MRPLYQQRVIDEKDALEALLTKLDGFVCGLIYESLPDMEMRLLTMQRSTMQSYHAILMARISLF